MAESNNLTSFSTLQVDALKQYEDFTIIWLDEQRNRDDDMMFFKSHINYCKVFGCLESCTNFIYALKEEKFFIIFSGYTYPFFVNILLEFPQILRMYLLLSNSNNTEEKDSSNDNDDMKILFEKHKERLQGPFIEKWSMFAKILDDIGSLFNGTNRTSPLSVFNVSLSENTLSDVTNNKSLFLWFQLLIELLLYMDDRDEARTDMSFSTRCHYNDNAKVLKTIANFAESYHPELALHWYTKDSFVYRLINKALRTQDIDTILKFRFFIKDLHNQLTQLHAIYCKTLKQLNITEFTVYRGQVIGVNEFKMLQNNIGNIVSTNSFFSATTNSLVACEFVGDGSCRPQYESVLFQIHIQTTIKTKPYAKVNVLAVINDENEIIFSMGTLFTINSVEQLTDLLWVVDITLTENFDQDLQELFEAYKWDIEKSSSNILTLGIFLMQIGDYARAIHYYEVLSKKPTLDSILLIASYYNIVVAYCEQDLYEQAIRYLEKCVLAYLLWFPNAKYNYQENITTRHYDGDKQRYEFTFVTNQDINDETSLEQHLSYIEDSVLASAFFKQLAYIYHKTGKCNEAQRIVKECTHIDKACLDDTHIDWYNYSVYDHVCQGDYMTAINEYKNTISNYVTRLPSKHPITGVVHYNMGDLFLLANQVDNALAEFHISSNIFRFCLPPQHPLLVSTLAHIELIHNSNLDMERVKADCLVQLICFPTPMMSVKLTSVLKDYLLSQHAQKEIVLDESLTH